MKMSHICGRLLVAFLLLNTGAHAESRINAATPKTQETTQKLIEAQVAEQARLNEVKAHAEPQMNVAELRGLGRGMADVAMTSLYEMGFTQGNVFEGASSEHEFNVFFPLPVDSMAKSGIIKLRYKTSALTGTVPNLRIDINDHTVYSTPLSLDPVTSGLDIPINTEDLKAGHIKLTVKASIMPTDVRCFDEHTFALHYIQILPETRLELGGLTNEVYSLRGVWSVLPKDVTMSIPNNPSPDIMKVILQAATQLRIAGKTTKFVKLPEMGNMVIAERNELAQWLAKTPGVTQSDLTPDSNIAVIHSTSHTFPRFIAMTEAAPERDMQLLARDWRKVTLSGEYFDQTPKGQNTSTHRTFTLGDMGMNDEPHTITRTTEWKFFAGLPQVPGDMRIKSLHVNVVAPPSKDRMNERLLLFVYVNNILQEVQPLDNTGKTQEFTFNIANYSQWVGRNYVKIMAQRFAPRDCMNSLSSYTIQITRDSTIEFEHFDVNPRIFNDLHPYFSKSFDLYIEPQFFDVEHLGLLATTLADQKYDLSDLKVISYDGSTLFKPTRPFMIYGRPKIALDDVTVRFDRGPIEVQTDDKRILMAVKKLPGISIAQVVRHNGFGGLWLAPSEDHNLAEIKEYFLEQGDTSFADPSGEVLNMKTRQMNRAKIEYPEFLDFFSKMGRYRFWIVALGWMSLALVLIMIYRRILQNQKKTK